MKRLKNGIYGLILCCTVLVGGSLHADGKGVVFSNPTGLNTTALFDSTGTYTLQFCSSDGAKSQCAQMTVTVNPSITMPKLNVGSGNAIAGNSLDIPVSLVAGSVGASGLQFDLVLPSGVVSNSVNPGASANAASKSVASNMVGGNLRVLISGFNQNVMASGVVAVINLGLSGTLPTGSIPLTLTNVVGTDVGGISIPMAASGLGGIGVIANKAPTVTVGPNQTVIFPGPANLTATATDDGAPNPPGSISNTWSPL